MLTKYAEAPAINQRLCTRCGGTGEYSYCTMYGRTCFKCGGLGVILRVVKGQAKEAATATFEECKVGDVVMIGNLLYRVNSVMWRRWNTSANQVVRMTGLIDGEAVKKGRCAFHNGTTPGQRGNWEPTDEMVGTEHDEALHQIHRWGPRQ